MKQVIIGGYYNPTHATATEYNTVAGGWTWSSTADARKQIVTTPGTLSNLLFELSGAPGAGKSYTISLLNVTQGTNLDVTISDTETTGENTGSIAVVAGDIIQLRCVPSGSPSTRMVRCSVLFEGTNPNESLILGTTMADNIAIKYTPIMSGSANGSTIETNSYQIIPTSGKIKNLYVKLDRDPGTAPEAHRFTLRRNGINGDDGGSPLQVTITADDMTGEDTIHEITVAAGDYVGLMTEPLNSPTNFAYTAFGFTFVADIDGESLLLGQSSSYPTNSAPSYNHLVSTIYNHPWYADEDRRYQGGQPVTLKRLYVKLEVAPGSGKSYVIAVRVNEVTKIPVTIAEAETTGNNVVDTALVANFDELNMLCTPSGSPTMIWVAWGLVSYIEVAAAGIENKSANMAAKTMDGGVI